MSATVSLAPCEDHPPVDPFSALLARLRREHVPFSAVWELTHACNLCCVMCYNVRRPEPELSTDECYTVLEQLASAGTLQLTLTGGEILVRHDFFAIAERARALGFALDLKTNGTLVTPEIADRLAALAPMQVDISLLGATEATFAAIAGRADVLDRVSNAVRLLQERRVRVKFNTLLLDLNFAERSCMIQFARELGVACEHVFKISPKDDGDHSAACHQLTLAQMTQALIDDGAPFVPIGRQPEDRTCQTGLSSCLIDPYGTVYPCVELRIPLGDLRRQRLAEIWAFSPELQHIRTRHIVANLIDCRDCALTQYCEGRCAGLAWKEHGDFCRANALACRQANARYVQQHPGGPVPETR